VCCSVCASMYYLSSISCRPYLIILSSISYHLLRCLSCNALCYYIHCGVAMYCAATHNVLRSSLPFAMGGVAVLRCIAMCCNVLRCIAMCCNVLRCIAMYCLLNMSCNLWRSLSCSVLQAICSVLQAIAQYTHACSGEGLQHVLGTTKREFSAS